uniref:Centromere protein J C-terminal domain-containing protein n=1 Tax=Rhizochromulina marina TaxID=1034831 RepID=A0A7S2R5W5_9STRA
MEALNATIEKLKAEDLQTKKRAKFNEQRLKAQLKGAQVRVKELEEQVAFLEKQQLVPSDEGAHRAPGDHYSSPSRHGPAVKRVRRRGGDAQVTKVDLTDPGDSRCNVGASPREMRQAAVPPEPAVASWLDDVEDEQEQLEEEDYGGGNDHHAPHSGYDPARYNADLAGAGLDSEMLVPGGAGEDMLEAYLGSMALSSAREHIASWPQATEQDTAAHPPPQPNVEHAPQGEWPADARGASGMGSSADLHVAEARAAPGSPSPAGAKTSEKLEKRFADGRVVTWYPNGTHKEKHPDGHSTVRFANGDIKRASNDGVVTYFYASAKTTHTTHPSGLETFEFPSGQVERHMPDGSKQIAFPDGTRKTILPNGVHESVFPDGVQLREYPEGYRDITSPDGVTHREDVDGVVTVLSGGHDGVPH